MGARGGLSRTRVIVTYLAGLAVLAAAQIGESTHRFSYRPHKRPLPGTSVTHYEILIPDVPGGGWVVGLHAAPAGATRECTINWVKLRSSPRGILRLPEEVLEAEAEIAPGTISVAAAPAQDLHLLVWCALPAGSSLAVKQSGRNVLMGRLEGDALIVNGTLHPHPAPYPTIVMWALVMPSVVAAPRGVIERRENRVVADWLALKRNALHLERPDLPTDPACCETSGVEAGAIAAAFTLEIRIGEDGKVRAVDRWIGETPAAKELIVAAVLRWQFQPFLWNGTPTEVTAWVPFSITRGGKVLSPVF